MRPEELRLAAENKLNELGDGVGGGQVGDPLSIRFRSIVLSRS